MSVGSRLGSLERRLGLDGGDRPPPVDVFLSDNGRDPDLCSQGICYNPAAVLKDPGAAAAYFRELRGEREGVVMFIAVSR